MKSESDLTVVDNILSMVLPLSNSYHHGGDSSSWDTEFYPYAKQQSKEILVRYNPETHIIVTKEQLDITQQLKALSGMALKIDKIQISQTDTSTKLSEIHKVQFVNVTDNIKSQFNKKPSKKQLEKERIERLESRRPAIHRKIANGY